MQILKLNNLQINKPKVCNNKYQSFKNKMNKFNIEVKTSCLKVNKQSKILQKIEEFIKKKWQKYKEKQINKLKFNK